MKQQAFGKTDMQVSSLGFGGAEIGFQHTPLPEVEQLLGTALDAGLNVIDTAACYGISEESIGKTVSHRRKDYYLFTKCGHDTGFDLPNWSPDLLVKSIEQSLVRLKTDHVDVVHLHGCSRDILENGGVIEVLEKAKQAGKTRYIGYSGDREDALRAVELNVFDSLEISVNIADQEAIEKVIPKAVEQGMGVIAKRPIANAAWLSESLPTNNYIQPYWHRLQQLDYDFLHGGIRDAVSTALRFTLAVSGVSTAIVGTAKPNRYKENVSFLENGPLDEEAFKVVRKRWSDVAQADWVGQG
ncbi:aldo/keto reductase [Alicyclobacillus sp. SO9]|uniref:aldo/keto reductase n=1 Tax=Alicyclobacillus sp. SO9 TaxID=2665646 RepID=UPI0018E6F8B7|nr:aldo/keto reductase [Alicyclobacillus sp. SO9]QQE77973.1 aldo/keto reductase [Alicyclobacillus sp. SO9]